MEPIYIADYNYPLPDERIAKDPLAERDHSKLLVYRPTEANGEGLEASGEGLEASDENNNENQE